MPAPPVAHLVFAEAPAIDAATVSKLFASMPEAAARSILRKSLENLSERFLRLECEYRACAFDLMSKEARKIVTIAEPIGLVSVSHCARALIDCVLGAQVIPVSATLARLKRCLDQSAQDIWTVAQEVAQN